MVRPYSLDLRERVVAAVAGGQSCRVVAKTFGVSVASVDRCDLQLVLSCTRVCDLTLPPSSRLLNHRGYAQCYIRKYSQRRCLCCSTTI